MEGRYLREVEVGGSNPLTPTNNKGGHVLWTVLFDKHVKTRKPHVCEGCHRCWPKGVRMRVTVGVWSGSGEPPLRAYYCSICDEFMTTDTFLRDATVEEELPFEPFWDVWPEAYMEVEAKALAILTKFDIPTVKAMLGGCNHEQNAASNQALAS